jgi:hypothetical protein
MVGTPHWAKSMIPVMTSRRRLLALPATAAIPLMAKETALLDFREDFEPDKSDTQARSARHLWAFAETGALVVTLALQSLPLRRVFSDWHQR